MKAKFVLLLFTAATAGLFALARPHNDIPSDLRDAVADRGFGASITDFTGDAPALPVPSPVKAAGGPGTKAPVKDWTVMYYINGKNNLDAMMEGQMADLEETGSSARVNVVVERGSIGKGLGAFDKKWTGSRRYYMVKKSADDYGLGGLRSKVLMEFPKADMGDYRHAVDFVNWARKNYPAKRYMFVIHNHGSGIRDPEKKPAGSKGISFDDETGNYITNVEIGKILRETGKVDVLVFDACLMQSAEIVYELKGLADFVIGSEEVAWGWTFKYGSMLRGLMATPAATGEQAALLLLKGSVANWKNFKKWSQISIIRMSELDTFISLLNHWTGLVEQVNDTAAVKAANKGVMRFTLYPDEQDPDKQQSLYGDLAGYVRLLNDNITSGHELAWALKTSGSELVNFIERRLIVANATTGKNYAGRSMADARGLSIYLPFLRGYSMVEVTRPEQTTIVINGVSTVANGSVTISRQQLVDARPEHRAQAERLLGGKYSDFAFAKDSRWEAFVKYLWEPGENAAAVAPGGSPGELVRPH
ncbi:MAG TPA: hypothetical protein DCZ92_03025 [Elusimicrobia bacterium]|nr:hypothetical protein [Elusimicrobiota bacterium]